MATMGKSFLVLLARATDRELAKIVDFLKAENRILRAKLPKHVEVSPNDRRTLVKLGRVLGGKAREVISIVSPRTFARWLQAENEGKPVETHPSKGAVRKRRSMSEPWSCEWRTRMAGASAASSAS